MPCTSFQMSCTSYTMLLLAALAMVISTVKCRPGIMQSGENPGPEDSVRSKRTVDPDLDKKAYDYYTKLHEDHQCHLPQLRIIPVQQIHPTNSVSYITGSVVLHRCAADTGCCPPKQLCVANDSENVEIPILVSKVGEEGGDHAQMMTFVNHTTCHCVPE